MDGAGLEEGVEFVEHKAPGPADWTSGRTLSDRTSDDLRLPSGFRPIP